MFTMLRVPNAPNNATGKEEKRSRTRMSQDAKYPRITGNSLDTQSKQPGEASDAVERGKGDR